MHIRGSSFTCTSFPQLDFLTLTHTEGKAIIMEALWKFEDIFNLTTGKASILLVCSMLALVGACTLIVLKRKASKNKIAHQDVASDETETRPARYPEMTPDIQPNCGWMSVKRVLIGSTRWCRASKWQENSIREKKEQRHGLRMGWQSHNSVSPVWQKPILRGEKCELPRFSGLILYDEGGRLLPESETEMNCKETSNQEKAAVTVRSTLRDLLLC